MNGRLELARAISANVRELQHRLTGLKTIHEVWLHQLQRRMEPMPGNEHHTREYEACESSIRSLVGQIAEAEILFSASAQDLLRRVVETAKRLLYLPANVEELSQNYADLDAAIVAALKVLRFEVSSSEQEQPIVPPLRPPSPWSTGSFYLAVLVVGVAAILVLAKSLPAVAFPVALVAAILILSVVGAFQLRHDGRLSQKNFLALMALTFKYLPWLRHREPQKDMPGGKPSAGGTNPP